MKPIFSQRQTSNISAQFASNLQLISILA